MLLDFKVSNFKSFVDLADFKMTAAPKQKGLDYSLNIIKEDKREIKALCSSVIYGPNAAGKSNIIQAIDVLRSIVSRGNIRNIPERNQANPAASSIELIPNNSLDASRPVEFSIEFYEAGMRFTYELVIEVGQFLEVNHSRKVQRERLCVNGEVVFCRDSVLLLSFPASVRSFVRDGVDIDGSAMQDIAQNSLNDEELFLTNGFKLIYAPKLARIITNWFANKIAVICRADAIQYVQHFGETESHSAYIDTTVNKAAKAFGINSNAIGFVVNQEGNEPQLCSLFKNPEGTRTIAVRADLFESYGTVRFVNLFPLIIRAIVTGGTLIMDEFDASIHPMALMSIVNIFHNDDINTRHAQLIFNTQNPIFLNANLFRRDEIKFVERDENTHYSSLYSLADFGTSGPGGVRNGEDYMKNYFISRYGAIRDIDFTPIFEDIMQRQSEGDYVEFEDN